MARKLDWFPFYAAAFQTDEAVRLMEISQVGVYILLLGHQWINGSIPADESQALALLQPQLSPLADDNTFRLASEVLDRCFPPSDDDPTRRQNRRLETVRAEQAATRERLSEAGRKGGRPKGGVSRAEKPGFSNTAKPGFAIDKEKSREELPTTAADAADEDTPSEAWLRWFLLSWERHVGLPNRHRIREAVLPLVHAHGLDQVWCAWDGFAREAGKQGSQVRFFPPRKFAETYAAQVSAWAWRTDEAGQEHPIPSAPGVMAFPSGCEPVFPERVKAVPA
jgi:hypothetical protein